MTVMTPRRPEPHEITRLGDVELEPRREPFDAVLDEMRELYHRKRGDYAPDVDPWVNFRDVGRQTSTTPGMACEALIAVKQSRLRMLDGGKNAPKNESRRDSRMDRAVYAVIAVAMADAGLYEEVA